MPAPASSHPVTGIVRDADSNLLDGASVVVTHSSSEETLSATSNSAGEYMVNLKNLTTWSVGDALSITSSKSTFGTKTETTTISSAGSTEQNITLAYTSGITIDTGMNRIKMNAAMLVDFEGNKITPDNPLPVPTWNFDIANNPSFVWAIRSDGQPNNVTATVKGVSYKKTYTYNSNGIRLTESSWVKE